MKKVLDASAVEVKALRDLIQSLCETTEAMPCRCAIEAMVCQRCWIMGHIDRGLAKIAKEPQK